MVKIMENLLKMDDLGVFPYFWKHPVQLCRSTRCHRRDIASANCFCSSVSSGAGECLAMVQAAYVVSWVDAEDTKSVEFRLRFVAE